MAGCGSGVRPLTRPRTACTVCRDVVGTFARASSPVFSAPPPQLLEKQKEGKKRMRAFGNVQVPLDAFVDMAKA